MDVRAGAAGQRLHRDDKNYHVDHKDQTQTGYQRESDVSLGVLVPGVQSTKENGATLVSRATCVYLLDFKANTWQRLFLEVTCGTMIVPRS